jgi:uncharacterized protein
VALGAALPLLHLVSIFLSLAAGACVYLFLLNRVLIQLRDARHKSWLIRAGALLTLGCAGVLGYLAAGTPWMILPAAVVIITFLGEVRRWMMRRRCRGEPPVTQENAGIKLAQPRTTTDLAVRRYALTVPGWGGPALRIAHVSDFHLNSHLPLAYFEDTMHRVADAQPDLLFFTGDFITDIQFVGLLPDVLSLAHGRLGTFGVLGNHDYWADPAAVTDAVQSAGVTLLGNESVQVPIGNGNKVLVTGCEVPWSHRPWQPPAVVPGELALMLTHTPDNVYRLSRLGFTAIFAGHYHAGQMRIPGLGALVVPSNYGRRFDHGHFVLNGTHLFVTAGVGSAEPPVRVWCQPDVFIVDIKGTQGS